jgi:hypothetical protein
MFRFAFISICVAGIVVADQSNPWDNSLDASLFVETETDLDDSGATDVADILELIGQWGTCTDCSGDLDGTGDVDITDLLTVIGAWGPNEILVLDSVTVDHAGVPCLSYGPDGELIHMFQWFPNEDNTLDFIARRVSYDNGETWSEIQSITWLGTPPSEKHSTQADPNLVLLPDNSWRLYFTCDPDGPDVLLPATYSAVSDDGLAFTWEEGSRMSSEEYGLLDPSVIYFNEEFHYFAPIPGYAYGSVHATSTDGVNFVQQEHLLDIDGRDDAKFLGNPAIVDGTLYFFGTFEDPIEHLWDGVFIAKSDDALDWEVVWEDYGEAADPAGIQTPDGLLMFVTALAPFDGGSPRRAPRIK